MELVVVMLPVDESLRIRKKKDKLINVNLIVHYLVTANMKLSVSVLVISKALKNTFFKAT